LRLFYKEVLALGIDLQHNRTYSPLKGAYLQNGRTVVFRSYGSTTLRPQPSPASYAELIAGIRAGDPSAVTNFRNAFKSGIRFFITRESNEIDVAARTEEAVMSVVEEITKGHITSPNLPSQILELLRRNIGLRKLSRHSAKYDSKQQSVADASQVAAATDLLKTVPEWEREALKRYYIDLESESDICAELELSIDQFRKLKVRLRTQFMNTWRQRGFQRNPE
jgi:hypothetical protein